MKPHPHAETIIAWANGAQIQFRDSRHKNSDWIDCVHQPEWHYIFEYRVKPAEPERIYPTCDLEPHQLWAVFRPIPEGDKALRATINYAFRHACDKGQIVTREEFDRAVGDREARDEAIAKAALKEINEWIERVNHSHNNIPFSFDVNKGHIKAIIHAANKE